jgi:hypothetical protein
MAQLCVTQHTNMVDEMIRDEETVFCWVPVPQATHVWLAQLLFSFSFFPTYQPTHLPTYLLTNK